jgi:hypothetical protein
LSAKSNLYYYHDQHSLHNNDALQTEHEQSYATACTAPHTNTALTANKSPPQNSFQHTTFHNPTTTTTTTSTASSITANKKNLMSNANAISTLNASESGNFAKKHSKSTKSLQKIYNSANNMKYYGEINDDDYRVDDDFCDNDILTGHYYHNNNISKNGDDRKGKKSKR